MFSFKISPWVVLLIALCCLSAKTLVHPDRVPEKQSVRKTKSAKKVIWKLKPLFPKRQKARRDTLPPPCDTLQLRSGKRLSVRILETDGELLTALDCDDPKLRVRVQLGSILHIDTERGERVGLEQWGYYPPEEEAADDRDMLWAGLLLSLAGLVGFILIFVIFERGTYARKRAILGFAIAYVAFLLLTFLLNT